MRRRGDIRQKGFSLFELAIVLVIAGLIAAAVETGFSVVRSAKIRSVATDIERFKASIRIFRDNYRELPGDMTKASAYWEDTFQQYGFDAADGNGDSRIEAGDVREDLLAWQHLTLAGMVTGTYNGTLNSKKINLGDNVPASKISSGGYWLHYTGPIYGKTGNFIEFASDPSKLAFVVSPGFGVGNAYAKNDKHNDGGDSYDDGEDCDNGHGNDADGVDDSNPGKGKGGPNADKEYNGEYDDDCDNGKKDDDENHDGDHDGDDDGEYDYDHDGNHDGDDHGNNNTQDGVFGDFLGGAIVNPQEARAIDEKMDDGRADEGNLMTTDGLGLSGCVNSGAYNLESTYISCRIHSLVVY